MSRAFQCDRCKKLLAGGGSNLHAAQINDPVSRRSLDVRVIITPRSLGGDIETIPEYCVTCLDEIIKMALDLEEKRA